MNDKMHLGTFLFSASEIFPNTFAALWSEWMGLALMRMIFFSSACASYDQANMSLLFERKPTTFMQQSSF